MTNISEATFIGGPLDGDRRVFPTKVPPTTYLAPTLDSFMRYQRHKYASGKKVFWIMLLDSTNPEDVMELLLETYRRSVTEQ